MKVRNLMTKKTKYGFRGHKFKDLTNKKFGMLTVIEFINRNKKGAKWLLRCECGNTVIRIAGNFTRKEHKHSCGCISKNPGKKNAGFRRLYNDYRASAFKRNYRFNITKKLFKVLVFSNCYYCNSPPGERYKKQVVHTLLANGIDRIDNTKNYTKENCVSCCSTCNKAKGSMSKSDFLMWVKKVHDHNFIWST